ncbi:hypothetical protein FisN_6Lh094 [Fistulifera solaris]|uniref:Coenzyme Q-binding protein COQ10 START domain-containing protein n=1 Tax=Fistulifera solaris TaxID=1519565 RepID=A0A1Z5K5G8_FISSO|nr:hypothetical protein FisN_6Lh094 [Fistulifera solaris]|eukprot:GAX21341.1 hypothetical protein FisN_6Lh094 [Fistulifera solaris]
MSTSSLLCLVSLSLLSSQWVNGFVVPIPRRVSTHFDNKLPTDTALAVWWFGGTQNEAVDGDADSCDLVPVRIERPSPSSRRIFGEIIAPVPLADVWSILTAYDDLSTHVPNLKESRITRRPPSGQPGDGSYECILFQKGAQKIVGFEFAASVTMKMKERYISESERRITFQCVDSMFFNAFDGEWKAEERIGADGMPETKLSYVVDVRPKGPVPVAALEWRIREDVPTNLRAVKRSAALLSEKSQVQQTLSRPSAPSVNKRATSTRAQLMNNMKMSVKWYKDETMEAYLTE